MTKHSAVSRILTLAAGFFSVAFFVVPRASADIIGVENATGPCSSNGLTAGGGTICSGNITAFTLSAIESGTEVLNATVGTQTSPVYLVDNDTGSSTLTFTFNGSLVGNQFLNCQENGGEAGDSCTISGSLGTVVNPSGGGGIVYGPPSPSCGNSPCWNPDVTVTLTVPTSGDFDLSFQSFGNGASGTTGSVTAPEPSSLLLLATGLFSLVGFARRKMNSY